MNQNTWQDFNDAEQQQGFDLIPKGALVKVRMTIKPGVCSVPVLRKETSFLICAPVSSRNNLELLRICRNSRKTAEAKVMSVLAGARFGSARSGL